jgi:hypothetical protein
MNYKKLNILPASSGKCIKLGGALTRARSQATMNNYLLIFIIEL